MVEADREDMVYNPNILTSLKAYTHAEKIIFKQRHHSK